MKSEPSVYGIADLKRDGVGKWGDIRNYQVRNLIRDTIKAGDYALLYHSSAKVIGCAGVMEVVGEAYPDPSQFDQKSQYFDPKSTNVRPRWLAFDVRFVAQFHRVVTLAEIKADRVLKAMTVTQKGNRLSISTVTKQQFERIVRLAQT